MSKIGQSTSIADKLAAKLEEERKEAETIALKELKTLAENLQSASSAALNSMQQNITGQITDMTPSLKQILRPIIWTTAACALIMIASLTILWVVSGWKWSELNQIRRQVSIGQQTARELEAKTGGIEFYRAPEKDGYVIVVPEASNPKNYRCGTNQVCIKITE